MLHALLGAILFAVVGGAICQLIEGNKRWERFGPFDLRNRRD
jgi:hypothetical protein